MTQKQIGHVFMSYSRTDEDVMWRVVNFLRSQGINVWVDNEKLIPGTPIWETEIEKAIFGADATVVILSPDSKASEWVRREISYTERYQKRIFPVLVRGDENSSVSIRLTNHQYVDIREDEEMGLKKLSAALSYHLEDLEAQKQKALEEVEKQAQAKAEREKEEREAVRLRLERERAEQEKVEREKAELIKVEREKLRRQEAEKEKLEKRQAENKVEELGSAQPQEKRRQEAVPSREEVGKTSISSRWFSILWIALGWGIGVPLGVSVLEQYASADNINPITFQISRVFIGALIGAFGGFITALSLWMENIISKRRTILGITLGWSVGWVVGWLISYVIVFLLDNSIGGPIGGLIGGAVGGLTFAFFLKSEREFLTRKNLLIIALGWAIGWGVTETLLWITNGAFGIGVAASLIGVIGGSVLYWQIETHLRSDEMRKFPIWVQVLGVALGWVFGLTVGFSYRVLIGRMLGMSFDDSFMWNAELNIMWVLVGIIGGIVTAIMSTYETVKFTWKSIIRIALGWAISLLIGWWWRWQVGYSSILIDWWWRITNPSSMNAQIIELTRVGIIQGALGGLVMAIILRVDGILSQLSHILWITLGWSISWGIFWAIGGFDVARLDYQREVYRMVSISPIGQVCSVLIGVIGGIITIWQIRGVSRGAAH